MASAVIFFGDLPAEIVSHIAAMLPVADVVRLAMTCRAICALATCEAMWRQLFLRDFGAAYAKGLPARPWPHRDHPDDPWHEMAVELWQGTDALATMPPRCRPVEHLPAPFARAFAVGKDWRWLYRVHFVTSSDPPDESFSGPRGFRSDASSAFMLDWSDGQPAGYVVDITFGGRENDEIVSWTEVMYSSATGSRAWSVEHTADGVTHRGMAGASGIVPAFVFSHSGARHWMAIDETKTATFAVLSTCGVRQHGRCHRGAIETTTTHYPDGSTIVEPKTNGRVHGTVEIAYANGDVIRIEYKDGAPTGQAEFVCLPACPRSEYAAGVVSGCLWRAVPVGVTGSPPYAMVPTDDSDAARLFWRYVAEGLIGWCPRTRRIVLDTVGASARWAPVDATPRTTPDKEEVVGGGRQ